MVKVREDLTGRQFGRLTVLEQGEDYVNPQGAHYARWKCQCCCENKTIKLVPAAALKAGTITSCGCVTKEKNIIQAEERARLRYKNNTYDFTKEYAIGYTHKGEEFWFDKEDYEKIKNYSWYYDSHGYLCATERNTREKVLFHRLVIGDVPQKMVVDHKIHPPRDGLKYDNRKCNLEIKTNSQNMMNAHLYSHNKSGVSGVTYTQNNGKWQVRIGVNGQRIHLGYYNSYEEAVQVRKEAEVKYFGDYRFDVCNKQEETK